MASVAIAGLIALTAVLAREPGLLIRGMSALIIGVFALLRLRRRLTAAPVLLLSIVIIAIHVVVAQSAATYTNGMYGVIGLSIAGAMLSENRRSVLVVVAAAVGAMTIGRITALDEMAWEAVISGVVAYLVIVFGTYLMEWARQEIGGTESRYQNLFDRSPVASWEEDLTGLAEWLDQLRAEGVADLRAYLAEHPDKVRDAVSLIEVKNVNDAAVELVGFPREALLGRLSMDRIVDDSPETIIEEIMSVWEGRAWLRVDLRGRSGHGLDIDGYLMMAAPQTRGVIDWSRVVVAMVDVSDQRMAQRRLEELIDSKDRFVATVSHELRTPLTAVVGLAEELRADQGNIGERERDDLLAVIADQAMDVGYIVEDLLVAARADLGKVNVRPETVELQTAVVSVLDSLRLSSEPTVTFEGEVVAKADPHRLRQILRNLLTNASRYGGPNVEVTGSVDGGWAVVEVRDDGEGIADELRYAVFEPYATAHSPTGVIGSVGLGLTVSRQLARLMEGDITYHRQNGFSAFRLELPAA